MKLLLCAVVASLALSGCASIVSGQNQSVSVVAMSDTGSPQVPGATCELKNDKGTWFVTTPGSATVRRSGRDLGVRCEKAPHEPGVASVKSATKAMTYGNILFGGPIGVVVDIGSGAAYDYPNLISVRMGKPPAPEVQTAVAPEPAVATEPTPSPPPEAVPPQPVAALSPPPAALPKDYAAKFSYQAFAVPQVRACNSEPEVTLAAVSPGVEVYSARCAKGEPLMLRCEWGTCRALR
jgi:hypothetical protein